MTTESIPPTHPTPPPRPRRSSSPAHRPPRTAGGGIAPAARREHIPPERETSPSTPPPLYNPETRSFHGPSLRRAILARGWTVADFARVARVNYATLCRALKGKPVRDGTAVQIFHTLEKREPMQIAVKSD